jgi:hypothetical protein
LQHHDLLHTAFELTSELLGFSAEVLPFRNHRLEPLVHLFTELAKGLGRDFSHSARSESLNVDLQIANLSKALVTVSHHFLMRCSPAVDLGSHLRDLSMHTRGFAVECGGQFLYSAVILEQHATLGFQLTDIFLLSLNL